MRPHFFITLVTSSVFLPSFLVAGHRRGRDELKEGLMQDVIGDLDGDPINPLHRGAIMSKDHLHEHMKEKIMLTPEEEAAISENEADFHFFKSHDTDGDNRLDGLELLEAISHGLDHQMDGMQFVNEAQKDLTIKRIGVRLIQTVDQILHEDDTDGDGRLTYPEYAHARLAATALKEYSDKNKPKG